MGAALSAPNPAFSTNVAITYFGLLAGAYDMNHASFSLVPGSWAVPVLPAIGYCDSGNPEKAECAVPLAPDTTCSRPWRMTPNSASSRGRWATTLASTFL